MSHAWQQLACGAAKDRNGLGARWLWRGIPFKIMDTVVGMQDSLVWLV
ncbi:MAG: hypothetical protein ACFCUU_16675 [Cyclobacteriaceae bacterium]